LTLPKDDLLDVLAADALPLLEAVPVPAYVVDCDRRVRWQNAASIELVGDVRGRLDVSVLGPADLVPAREAFEQKRRGAPHTELKVCVNRPNGTRVRVAVSSVPLRSADGAMVGSFGLVQLLGSIDPLSAHAPRLSPRDRETLALLAAGYSTAQIAEQMNIAEETVRNYVKRVLRSLGASSRVQAVAKARRLGLT
jgi:DNA-binding CsgD family transcriptional regulator